MEDRYVWHACNVEALREVALLAGMESAPAHGKDALVDLLCERPMADYELPASAPGLLRGVHSLLRQVRDTQSADAIDGSVAPVLTPMPAPAPASVPATTTAQDPSPATRDISPLELTQKSPPHPPRLPPAPTSSAPAKPSARAAGKQPMPNGPQPSSKPSSNHSSPSLPRSRKIPVQSMRGHEVMARARTWAAQSQAEREKVRNFWRGLDAAERKDLLMIEKDWVMRRVKDGQRTGCACAICRRKRSLIEHEVDTLYLHYYDKLERALDSSEGLFPGSVVVDSTGAVVGPDPLRGDRRDEEYEDDDFEDDEFGDEDEDDDLKTKPSSPLNDWCGTPVTVRVADDLLKNQGRKYLEMVEQMAYMRAETDALEGQDFEGWESEMDAAEATLDFGTSIFEVVAARLFEQRVHQALREHVAQDRQRELLRELAAVEAESKDKAAKRERELQKKRDKKRLQREKREAEQQKRDEEERARQEVEAKARAKRREAEVKKQQEMRERREAERKTKEADRQRREEERKHRAEGERARELKLEQKRNEKEEESRRQREAKNEAKRREKEMRLREAKETEDARLALRCEGEGSRADADEKRAKPVLPALSGVHLTSATLSGSPSPLGHSGALGRSPLFSPPTSFPSHPFRPIGVPTPVGSPVVVSRSTSASSFASLNPGTVAAAHPLVPPSGWAHPNHFDPFYEPNGLVLGSDRSRQIADPIGPIRPPKATPKEEPDHVLGSSALLSTEDEMVKPPCRSLSSPWGAPGTPARHPSLPPAGPGTPLGGSRAPSLSGWDIARAAFEAVPETDAFGFPLSGSGFPGMLPPYNGLPSVQSAWPTGSSQLAVLGDGFSSVVTSVSNGSLDIDSGYSEPAISGARPPPGLSPVPPFGALGRVFPPLGKVSTSP